jgi:hypothetical protein
MRLLLGDLGARGYMDVHQLIFILEFEYTFAITTIHLNWFFHLNWPYHACYANPFKNVISFEGW